MVTRSAERRIDRLQERGGAREIVLDPTAVLLVQEAAYIQPGLNDRDRVAQGLGWNL
jgi:hypothetical protein